MNLNEKAIDLLEGNEYDEALLAFQQAVEKSRDVQSLTNLAWIVTNEEDDFDQAVELLKEVVQMKPTSYFPYNLLGEVYMQKKMWQEASNVLRRAIEMESTTEAHFNLGATLYHLGNFEEAATFYLASAGDSDYSTYGYVRCLINLGKKIEAKEKLDAFSEDADDFVGEIEIADFYVELNCYEQAVYWYEKGFKDYYHQVSWIGRYIYALLQLNQTEKAQEIQQIIFSEKKEELRDNQEEVCDAHWTELDKQENIHKTVEDIMQLEEMADWISNKAIPTIQFDVFDPSISPRCYLFGCKRHGHPEYME